MQRSIKKAGYTERVLQNIIPLLHSQLYPSNMYAWQLNIPDNTKSVQVDGAKPRNWFPFIISPSLLRPKYQPRPDCCCLQIIEEYVTQQFSNTDSLNLHSGVKCSCKKVKDQYVQCRVSHQLMQRNPIFIAFLTVKRYTSHPLLSNLEH